MNYRISGAAMAASLIFLAIFLGIWLYQSYEQAKVAMQTELAFEVVNTSSKLKDTFIGHYFENVDDSLSVKTMVSATSDKKMNIVTSAEKRIMLNVDSAGLTKLWTSIKPDSVRHEAIQMKIIKNLDTMVGKTDLNIFFTSDKFGNKAELDRFNFSFWDVLKQIKTNILIAVLLFTIVGLSFILLYRNLNNQRKLTQLKNNFISNMTHELKTPLSTVSVALEAISNFDVLEDRAKTKDYLAISQSEITRLSLLVDKVLSFQKMESGLEKMKKDEIVIQELIEKVIGSMRLQLEKKGATLETQFPEESVRIAGDQVHLTNVLYNLIDNALKYSNAHPHIKISLQSVSDKIVLKIADNGIGIPQEFISGIFDRFFRVPDGERHNTKGYGLGLFYVKQVLELHGGQISVDSKEKEGSCFTITIPTNA
ncbi:MAG: HAMP domain-containing histidine kinase [Saprospiraceae bacterium]|nr:HAMP domain-containing histidine kinase [Saprospiraceae bacterium]